MSLDFINFEEGKVEVVEYSQTEAALAELRSRFAEVPDCSNKENYEFVKAGIRELVKYRTTLEKKRKEIKQPMVEAGRIVDAEAKRITGAIKEIEQPLVEAKKAQDELKERQEQERIARLHQKVDAIRAHVPEARQAQDSVTIANIIEKVDLLDVDHGYYDLTKQAQDAKQETLDELGRIYTERLHTERTERELAAARAEAAQLRAKSEELERQVAETPKTPEAPPVADNNTLAPEQMVTPDVSGDILKAAQVLVHEFCDMITVDQAAGIVEFIAAGCVPGVHTDF